MISLCKQDLRIRTPHRLPIYAHFIHIRYNNFIYFISHLISIQYSLILLGLNEKSWQKIKQFRPLQINYLFYFIALIPTTQVYMTIYSLFKGFFFCMRVTHVEHTKENFNKKIPVTSKNNIITIYRKHHYYVLAEKKKLCCLSIK